MRRCAMLDMNAIATQKENGTAQSFRLTLHEQDKVR
jgi:hypothetical protein